MRSALPHIRPVSDVVADEAVADARQLRDDERSDDDPDEHVRREQVVDSQDRDAFDGEQHEQERALPVVPVMRAVPLDTGGVEAALCSCSSRSPTMTSAFDQRERNAWGRS